MIQVDSVSAYKYTLHLILPGLDTWWKLGGAFRQGSAGQYSGSNFVAVGDVILVTINYRLSALGFLTTGDDRLKGRSSIIKIYYFVNS